MSEYSMDNAFEKAPVPWWLVLVEGIAAIVVGVLLLMNPAKMSVVLVQVLAIYWLVKGIVAIISIFVDSSAWGWKLFVGIVGIIAGYVLIEYPIGGTVTVGVTFTVVLGLQGIIMGIVEIIQAFQGGGWGIGILGGLSVVIGIWLLLNAWAAAAVLPWVLGILAIAGGIFAIVMAFRLRT
ncbi:MAG: HdeD family acid-resistance protein [Candidatus Promineifilaceae bacterium]|jgi:uncharacterized membrane protein HdeD (DUF308 family)